MSLSPDRSALPPRIGAVRYLNSRPLIVALPEVAPEAEVSLEVPSRLADGLAAGDYDVALVPSIEYFRHPDRVVVSDACIACESRVESVRLCTRVPVPRIRRLALDAGSRTSSALVQILLRERFNLRPALEPLPLGTPPETTAADAALVIGDRGITAANDHWAEVWDLGEQWRQMTDLPFVFAMWVARREAVPPGLAEKLSAARDLGCRRLESIAAAAAAEFGLPARQCLSYLRDALSYHLGPRQRQGLLRFYKLAVKHELAPPGVELV